MIIRTFIINLKTRTDRKDHIISEFAGRDEFLTTIVDAHAHDVGAVGLWYTIRHVIQDLVDPEDEFVLICEDDHVFTDCYSKQALFERIAEAKKLNCDVLSGGVSWFMDAIQVSGHLFWTNRFSGTQFIVIFRNIFDAIINSPFTNEDCADFKLRELSDKIYFTFPYFSIQKEFGYSDVTSKNNGTERVETLFTNSAANAQNLIGVRHYFNGITQNNGSGSGLVDVEDLCVPTYIINPKDNVERRTHIVGQFEGRPEFNISMVDACDHEIEALGKWLTLRKVIELAILKDDHVIIVCDDDHEFTSNYSKSFLFQNIVQAQKQRCDYLTGGTAGFHFAVPVSKNRFWTNHCMSTQFIILYRPLFKKILDEPFDESIIASVKISQLAANKMILFPFVSVQREFGRTNNTCQGDEQKGVGQNEFDQSSDRLKIIQEAFARHSRSGNVQAAGRLLIN